MAYYRNRETEITQFHPVSGLGESFNSDEIGEDGKELKPRIPLGTDKAETNRRVNLASSPKTPEATTGDK